MAIWLDTAFYAFDNSIFSAMNALCVGAGAFFTPFFKVVSFFGEGGIFLLILAFVLTLFKKTRQVGISMLFAIAIGAIFTNLIIKKTVARVRPYNADPTYRGYWLAAGAEVVGEYSFPSGHATVVMTSMLAFFLGTNKKKSFWVFLFVILTCISRVYLCVHYATDVIAGVMIGAISGTLGYFLARLLFRALNNNQDKKFCKMVVEGDLICTIKEKFNKEK